MRWGLSALFVFSGALSSATDVPKTITESCMEAGLHEGAWQDLTAKEPRIQKELESIARESGFTGGKLLPLNTCQVTRPMGHGVAPDGMRTVVIEKHWINDGMKAQGGIKILYWLTSKDVYDAVTGEKIRIKTRAVRGIVLCRTPQVCEQLGIAGKKADVVLPTPIDPGPKDPDQPTEEFPYVPATREDWVRVQSAV